MKTVVIFLSGIFTFTITHSQIKEFYEPNFEKFNLSEFGFQGRIKTITTIFLHKNDSNEFVPYGWKTIKMIHHFNESGNLIKSYGIGRKSDTVEITFYSYDEKNKISNVKNHTIGFYGEYNTKDLRNWELNEAKFEWNEAGDNIKKVRIEPYMTITQLNDYNANHQMTKTVRLDNTSETNSSLDKTEYYYNEKGQLIKSICLKENQQNISGEILFTYIGKELETEHFISFDGNRTYSSQFKNGMTEFLDGKDTLTEGYSFSRSILNDNGECISVYNHSTNDGEFKNRIYYTYSLDEKGNLTELDEILQNEIVNSMENKTIRHSKTKYKIEYF